MLQLKNIVKTYVTGDLKQDALKGVSVTFRENEFVSILGQSGSGKTTMLNIIGGLDRYTSGDLIINGVSTKKYRDADWDYYRNHSIGFVFQSYNLIPHQTVLANVEMALTLAGVSKKERKARAAEALRKVGLADHMHKKPNQMSGGQMQRVAIARALVNNPDVLLADEPTGALDSETSIQIMELLKEIAKDKLVIMVTHNPELAEQYSTRIVRLKDGEIVSDTNPCTETDRETVPGKKKKISMSFATALSLSFNNLKTKKGRTFLTAFAGSIGIIGIALILSLSTGMNRYIDDVQKDTMASYPITIDAQTIDASGFLNISSQMQGAMQEKIDGTADTADSVSADYTALEMTEMVQSSVIENNLTAFKRYLDDPDSRIHQYLGENGVVYSYDVKFSVYSKAEDGTLTDTEDDPDEDVSSGSGRNGMAAMFGGSMFGMRNNSGASNFSELAAGSDGQSVSQAVQDKYEVLYGSWPQAYDEVVLVLDRSGKLPVKTMYQLGLITKEQYQDVKSTIENGGDADAISLDYEEVCGHTFSLVCAADHYVKNEDGTFRQLENAVYDEDALLSHAVTLKISGIVRLNGDADSMAITTAVAYSPELTSYVIDRTAESAIVKAQEETPDINVLNGAHFSDVSDEQKAEDVKTYISNMSDSEKSSLYQMMQYYTAMQPVETGKTAEPESGESAENSGDKADLSGAADSPEDESGSAADDQESGVLTPEQQAALAAGQNSGMLPGEASVSMMVDQWLASNPDQEILLQLYDSLIGSASYEDNMKEFGSVSVDAPSEISIYVDNFENKEAVADCINEYNETADEDSQISYTDYVALLTSSLTSVINGISYVLIAFVAISLVVSCIMIGIITHISVMERTREIGILRALGASKRNISQVFNAETFIIGCIAGLLGIGVSLLLLIPINSVIAQLSGMEGLTAQLPASSAAILIVISIVITIVGGLLPAKKAAKKDPVAALRTE